MKNKIIVAGSINVDMVVKTTRIPDKGETVLGGEFLMNTGGKGANQAVAVARLGGDVAFVGKVGDDMLGRQSMDVFNKEGLDCTFISFEEDIASGMALITVDKRGENSIVVAPGANARLTPEDIRYCIEQLPQAKILLVQLEIPMDSVEYALKAAKEKNMQVILNPAPASREILSFLGEVDILTPNETEASLLSGVDVNDIASARKAAKTIQEAGVRSVVVTLGKKGAILLENDIFTHIETPVVNPIDTTAAGDVFNGALSVAVSEGKALSEAVRFACRAASISVTRMGAVSSIPHREEIEL